MDWDPEHQFVMDTRDICLTLIDSFGGSHSLTGSTLNIYNGTLKDKVHASWKPQVW
jgi:hypothetical protein